ncbi:hypothetical protein COB64_00530 [Candidatus Wolfebacteria bacterium]|nr:MAG: hypothetical protein COB64_00530 [Candidatus Wolfebacteria bacterium]
MYLLNKILEKLNLFSQRGLSKMRKEGKLFFISELIPYFKNSKVFMFGNGGSVANLKDVSRLKEYNLLSVHNGPVHFFRKYGFMPNLWFVHYGPTLKVVLKEEVQTPLDFSETFILVPANDSDSSVHFSSAIVKKFLKKHPEATCVLYREIEAPMNVDTIDSSYMSYGIEPIRVLGGGNVENSFLPLCGFLGIRTLFFSGVDHMQSTGHFYDKKRMYQTINGTTLEFPEKEMTLICASIAKKIADEKNIGCFRLEKKETILQIYPYIDFDSALKYATSKITPAMVRKR